MLMVTLIRRPELEALPAGAWRHKPGIANSAVKMPFPNESSAIARVTEKFGNRDLGFTQAEIVCDHAIHMCIGPGHQNCPGRAAHRHVGLGAPKDDAFAPQRVEVRCLHIRIASDAQCRTAHLVGDKQEDVRPR